MNCPEQGNNFELAMKQINEQGFDGMGAAIQILINAAMKIEREQFLGASSYERSDERSGYANGFKPKMVKTRLGALDFKVPQVRDSSFYPSSLTKGLRSEQALRIAVAEMYFQGVSTRKVTAIMEQLCGLDMTSTQVSRASAELDKEFTLWRTRDLGAYPYVFFDARYESIRHGGCVVDCAVLTAIGISPDHKREVLGVSISLSEAEVHWRAFFSSLQSRGLKGIHLIISDDHAGLKAARKSVFPSIPWQRCHFHLQQNAQKYVPKKDLKKKVASSIRSIFNAPNREEAESMLERTILEYQKEAPSLSEWMGKNLAEGFTVFSFPESHRKYLRTSNISERLNKEIKRRTRVATIFPNEDSCLRLVTAIVMEVSEEWISTKAYLPKE